jgi:hypothetical protein
MSLRGLRLSLNGLLEEPTRVFVAILGGQYQAHQFIRSETVGVQVQDLLQRFPGFFVLSAFKKRLCGLQSLRVLLAAGRTLGKRHRHKKQAHSN